MGFRRGTAFRVVITWLAVAFSHHVGAAATWTFGSNSNGLTGLVSKSLPPIDGVGLTIAAENPAGARLREVDSAGVSVDSSGLVGIVDTNGADKINLVSVDGVARTAAERLQFSFVKPGVLTGIDFDGIKDESLEYIALTSFGGVRVNFFDSFANTTIPGAVDAAVATGAITGQVVYLLELSSDIDDEAQGIHIPFSAGQQFVLNYSELGTEFHPVDVGNGARLQGITVQTLPEPATCIGAFLVVAAAALLRRKRGNTGTGARRS